jgi:hypothetical protein
MANRIRDPGPHLSYFYLFRRPQPEPVVEMLKICFAIMWALFFVGAAVGPPHGEPMAYCEPDLGSGSVLTVSLFVLRP